MDKAALENLVAEALEAFERASSSADLEQEKARYLGKTGALTAQLKGLSKLSPEERPQAGAWINEAKQRIENAVVARRTALMQAAVDARLAKEALDVTLPGRRRG